MGLHLSGTSIATALPVYPVKSYGAIADGVVTSATTGTDARAAINSAIVAANAAGGGVVDGGGGTYVVKSSPGITLLAGVTLANITLVQGYWPGLFTGLVQGTGTYTNTDVTGATLASDPAGGTAGLKQITLTSNANIVAGNYYVLGSTKPYMNPPNDATYGSSGTNDFFRWQGEVVRVLSVDASNAVTFRGAIKDNYLVADATSLHAITFLERVGLRNVRIVNPEPNTTHISDLVKLSYCRNFAIENVTLEAGDGPGIHLDMCLDGSIRGGHILDLTNNLGGQRYGYGVLFNRATQNVVMSGVHIRGGRHATTTNGVNNRRGVPSDIVITGCTSEDSTDASFDTHIQGRNITFSGCSASSNVSQSPGFQVRSPDTRVIGCSTDYVDTGVLVYQYAHGSIIHGNVLRHGTKFAGTPAVKVLDAKHVMVSHNVIDSPYTSGIGFYGTCDYAAALGNIIRNPGQITASPGILVDSACTAAGLRFADNAITVTGAASGEARSLGSLTYPIDIGAASITSAYIVSNWSIGAAQTSFVNISTTGHTIKRNRQLDRTEASDDLLVVNTQTASYTLVLGDQGKVVEMNNASANTLTVPPNSSVAFPVGTVLEVHQYGAGQTTITPGAGVTIRSDSGALKTTAQYATASLRKRATDEWVASGDLTV